MRGHDPAGKLRASWQPRERLAPFRGAPTYYVGAICDDIGIVWTCEARKPHEAHEHQMVTFAHDCAEKALVDETWKDDLPPAPA